MNVSTAEDGSNNRQPSQGCSRRDSLEYLADLVLELKSIAAPYGLDTLAGLLDLAHREALLQSRRKS